VPMSDLQTNPTTITNAHQRSKSMEPRRQTQGRDWEVVLSEAIAYLLSAHDAIEELRLVWPLPRVPLVSIAFASTGVAEALRALDKVGMEGWSQSCPEAEHIQLLLTDSSPISDASHADSSHIERGGAQ
jgi:hypothetical protein